MTNLLGVLILMGMHAHGAPPDDGHGHGHGERGSHGNPADMDAYIEKLQDPERDAWQKPAEVVAALGLKKGSAVCDIGVGPGYFTLHLAPAVGADGRIYAVDVEPQMLAILGERVRREGLRNVTPVMGLPGDPLLPAASCDVILIVDTYHHFPGGADYLRTLGRYLAKGGRLVNIDFHKRELPVGPPPDHKIAREEFLADADKAGFRLAAEHDLLAYQYFLELVPK